MRRPSLYFDIAAEDKSGRAFSSMHSHVDKSERSLSRMRNQFAAVAGAATAFGAAITAAARGGAIEIDRAAKSARRMDASIGGFRGLELAASEAGVPLSVLANEVQNLNRELANIGTSGNADRALSRVGLTAADLAGLDADEKLATIADRVEALGLSAGEASALLRDFGIRNREMALLLVGGGDAIRQASSDIDEYGLALSSVEASRIETANDQIARLGLVTQYAGQQLAVKLVPAMGKFAQAVTDSLREGGLLRQMLDGLAENIDTITVAFSALATVMAGRLVMAAGSAAIALAGVTGPLGITLALLGAAGSAFVLFRDGVESAGRPLDDAKQAVNLLNEALTDFNSKSPEARSAALEAAAAYRDQARSALQAAVAQQEFNKARLAGIRPEGLENIKRQGETNPMYGVVRDWEASQALIESLDASITSAEERIVGLSGLALSGLGSSMTESTESTHTLNTEITGLDTALSRLSGGSLGDTEDGITSLGRAMGSVRDQAATAFTSIVTGAESARDAIGGLLASLANMAANRAFTALFDNMLGSVFSAPLPAFAAGTNYAPGGLALVGERGPEIVNLPRGSQVIPAGRTRDMLGGGGGGTVRIVIEEAPGFASRVRSEAEGVAVEVTRAGIGAYDRSLPGRVQQISRDPRRRT